MLAKRNLNTAIQNFFDDDFVGLFPMRSFNYTKNNYIKTHDSIGEWQYQDDHCVLKLELPGFKKSDLKIKQENGYIIIDAINDNREAKSSYLVPNKDIKEWKSTLEDGILSIIGSYDKEKIKNKLIEIT